MRTKLAVVVGSIGVLLAAVPRDPKAYTKPWTVTIPFDLLLDMELIEHLCENEKDVVPIFGKP